MTRSASPELPRPPKALTTSPALVVINGDDVYEDLFTAGLKLQDILIEQGFAARAVMGTARLADCATADLIVLYTALGHFPPSAQAALADAVHAGAGLHRGARLERLPQPRRPARRALPAGVRPHRQPLRLARPPAA